MAGELGFEPRHLAISPVFKTGPLAVRTSTHNFNQIIKYYKFSKKNTTILNYGSKKINGTA